MYNDEDMAKNVHFAASLKYQLEDVFARRALFCMFHKLSQFLV